jgi:4-amino-4-deoxy-L-arabinose transferase-like glycosyltransferase
MVGWWLWAMQQISSHPVVLRLPAAMLWIVICFGLMDLIKRIQPNDTDQRWVFGSLFLALPFTWGLNFITTDTPLIFFAFFSGYAFVRAEISGKLAWDAACGVLLGLALLSKYFAGLLALTFAACLLLRHRGAIRITLIALCALPFMALNLAWNSTHCWNNLLFNLINRHQGTHFSAAGAGVYLAMLILLVTPWTLFRLIRHKEWRDQWYIDLLYLLPLSFFLILSFWKPIGLHWILGFLPFIFLQTGLITDINTLRRHKNLNLLLGVPVLSLLLALTYLPTASFQSSSSYYTGIVMHRHGQSLATRLVEDLPPNTVLMTRSYSQSSLLAFHSRTYVPVFGPGTSAC